MDELQCADLSRIVSVKRNLNTALRGHTPQGTMKGAKMNDKMLIVPIPLKMLEPHPDNPRKDLGDLTELVESIKANGIMQNLTVVASPDPDLFRVVIGHRRMAAAKLAGLTEVPCVISDMDVRE